MLSFALYVVGAIVVIAGLAWIATLLGAASVVVTGAAVVLLVLALILAAIQRRAIEPPSTP